MAEAALAPLKPTGTYSPPPKMAVTRQLSTMSSIAASLRKGASGQDGPVGVLVADADASRILAANTRGFLARREQFHRAGSQVRLAARARGVPSRRKFLLSRHAAITIQKFFRAYRGRRSQEERRKRLEFRRRMLGLVQPIITATGDVDEAKLRVTTTDDVSLHMELPNGTKWCCIGCTDIANRLKQSRVAKFSVPLSVTMENPSKGEAKIGGVVIVGKREMILEYEIREVKDHRASVPIPLIFKIRYLFARTGGGGGGGGGRLSPSGGKPHMLQLAAEAGALGGRVSPALSAGGGSFGGAHNVASGRASPMGHLQQQSQQLSVRASPSPSPPPQQQQQQQQQRAAPALKVPSAVGGLPELKVPSAVSSKHQAPPPTNPSPSIAHFGNLFKPPTTASGAKGGGGEQQPLGAGRAGAEHGSPQGGKGGSPPGKGSPGSPEAQGGSGGRKQTSRSPSPPPAAYPPLIDPMRQWATLMLERNTMSRSLERRGGGGGTKGKAGHGYRNGAGRARARGAARGGDANGAAVDLDRYVRFENVS